MAERVFLLPDPGEGLTEAEVVAWLVAEGDTVALNQPIAEVETAKAVVEIPSPFSGVVVRLHASAGGSIAVGQPLVTFAVEGDGTDSAGGSARSHAAPSGGGEASDGSQGGAGPPAPPAPAPAAGAVSTPAVRRLARDLGVEIGTVAGTGAAGRVSAEDVRRAASPREVREDRVAVSGVRRAIAETLTRQAAIPQVTTFRTVDCTEVEAFRGALGLSPVPVVAAALCRVVAEHPLLNAAWDGDAVTMRASVHLGVAADTPHGLMVPVVRDAHSRGIGDLSVEIRRLAELARGGALGPADTADATIGISNTGSYGSEAGTPILTPGSAVTVAVGVIEPRALVVDEVVAARPACTLSLTFDHRVLDGAAAGRALTDLVSLLEDADRLRELPR